MSSEDKKHRSHLPMPNTARPTLITYDAKDPDTKFPADRAVAPARGRAQRAASSSSTTPVWLVQRLGGPCQTPNAEKLRGGRAEIQPLPHHRPLLADAPGAS